MRQISNPNRTLTAVFLVLGVAATLLGAVAWLGGGDDGFVWGLVGVIFGGTFLLVTPILHYTGKSQMKEIAELVSGQGLLARWTYDPDEWQRFTANEYERGMKQARKASYWTFGIAFALLLGGGLLGGEGIGVAYAGMVLVISLVLTAVVGGLFYLIAQATHRSHLAGVGEVFIGGTSVYVGDKFHSWKSKWAHLEKVTYEPGDPSVVEFAYRVGGGDQTSYTEVRVPVPRGREEEAEQLVQSFYAEG